MLKISENGKIIDLKNLPSNFEIPIESLFNYSSTQNIAKSQTQKKSKTFTYEELNLRDSSAAIKYDSMGNSVLVNINGPRECKIRDKTNNENSIAEIYTKFNIETKKESKFFF